MKRLLTTISIVFLCAAFACAQLSRLSTVNGLPSNKVDGLEQDNRGYVWIGTENGLCRYDGYALRYFAKVGVKGAEAPAHVRILTYDSSADRLWIKTIEGSVACYDTRGGGFKSFTRHEVPPKIANNANGYKCGGCLFRVADETRLIITLPNGKVETLDLLTGSNRPANRGDRYRVTHLGGTRFAIATYGAGLFLYDTATGTTEPMSTRRTAADVENLLLTDVMLDRSGMLWVAQEDMGVMRLPMSRMPFMTYAVPQPDAADLLVNATRHVLSDGAGGIYAVSRTGAVFAFDAKTLALQYLRTDPYPLYSMHRDRLGRLWTGTRGGGLYIDGQLYSRRLGNADIDIDDVMDIVEDSRGRLWLATLRSSTAGGLICATLQGGRLTAQRYRLPSMNIHALTIAPDGRLWAAATTGLATLDITQANVTERDVQFFTQSQQTLPIENVIVVHSTQDGAIWLGGTASGIVRCTYNGTALNCQQLTTDDAAGCNNIMSIIEDSDGTIWAGTEGGLIRAGKTGTYINTFRLVSDLRSNVYHENSVMALPDGRLLFGSNNGVAVVNPRMAQMGEQTKRDPAITDVAVAGRSLMDIVGQSITLSHDQNDLTIRFSTFDYNSLANTANYQYYLEGMDDTWQPTTTHGSVTYSPLAPGSYTFHLRAMQPNGEWSDEQTLDITIHEPWYNTWWAWLTYIVAAAALLIYIYRNRRAKYRLTQRMQTEQEQMNFRVNFFMQVTHEFRTPLTIMQDAIARITSSLGRPTAEQADALNSAHRGMKRMKSLADHLLEFKRIQTGDVRLHVAKGDLVAYVREIYNDFLQGAERRQMTPEFATNVDELPLLFDPSMVETVVYNLLSNTLKYAPTGGRYRLSVRHEVERGVVRIVVEDNGPGIDDKRQPDMFKMFMNGNVSRGGIGIGLYTARHLATVHHGTLTYEASPTLGGAAFTLTLPADDEVYSAEEYDTTPKGQKTGDVASLPHAGALPGDVVATPRAGHLAGDVAPSPRAGALPPSARPQVARALAEGGKGPARGVGATSPAPALLPTPVLPHIIVIEDDIDIQQITVRELSRQFTVSAYANGREGFEAIRRERPALIVCDLMLPDMDGLEIASRVRGNEPTATTPFIVLTALDDEQTQMRAYQAGVDDYMTKPCNYQLLRARAQQLILWARGVAAPIVDPSAFAGEVAGDVPTSAHAGDVPHTARPQAAQASAEDDNSPAVPMTKKEKDNQEFIETFKRLVAEGIGDTSFTIDDIAASLHIGRTKLYGKVKDIMGQTPNKYIMRCRMDRAAELLTTTDLTAAQVCEQIGLEDVSYFNKCFKAYFNETPARYSRNTR